MGYFFPNVNVEQVIEVNKLISVPLVDVQSSTDESQLAKVCGHLVNAGGQ